MTSQAIRAIIQDIMDRKDMHAVIQDIMGKPCSHPGPKGKLAA